MFIPVLALCFVFSDETGSAKKQEPPKDEVVSKAILEQPENTRFSRADFDLGVLETGSTYSLKLQLANTGSDTLVFGKVVSHCSCANLTVNSNVLLPGKGVTFTLDLKTPKIGTEFTDEVQTSFAVNGEDDKQLITVMVKYRLKGMLSFKDSFLLLKPLKNKKITFHEIPFAISEPLKAKDVEVRASKTLSEVLQFELVSRDEKNFVKVSFDPGEIPSSGLTGEIWIAEDRSKKQDSLYCTLRLEDEVKLSPKTLRMKRVGDSNKYEASAFVRIDPSAFDDELAGKDRGDSEKSERKPREVSFSANLEGSLRTTIKQTELSTSVYRVKVFAYFEKDAIDGVASWRVRVGKKTYRFKNDFEFLSD